MANVFDILNRKSSSSAEGTENEQMSRISSRTPGSSDSLQVQGVNNDASAFENKDGAKASGNYAYGVESRQETQEATSPFTIPKLKRSKQDLFMDISTESREWQQEILPSLTKYFRFPQSSSKFEFVRVSMIQNAERTQKYLDKRKEMRQNGYSERDITDSFAFLYVHVDDDKQVEKISREGLHIGNLSSSTIGHPGMGAQLCRYIDTIRPVSFFHGSMGKLLVFKVMKGKVKAVTENRSGPSLEPTPNYDCHMAKCSLDVSPDSQQQFYELYQMYLYEYGEDMTVEPYPRHVLPYAVITFRYKELPPSPRHLDSSPVYSPRLSSPSVPKFTVSAPKEADDPEYVIWCGHLRVKDILDCQVKMVSTASQYKPAHLGTVLNVRDTCEMKVAWERYFKEMSCLRKTGEVYWKGWYINVAELRPRPDSKMQFQRLMNHLGKTESLAVLKPENDVILLLAPNSELTSHLFDDKSRKSCEKGTRSCIGLTRPHHYPMMFYCIFLSRQSSKFKSPGYIQKGLHQRSGSCTPAWVDSGQISPISINVHPSSRPHTAPASPALLSPTLGLSFHSSSDRSPGYGASPRDELAVWTGVDDSHSDDTVKNIKVLSEDQPVDGQEKDKIVPYTESESEIAGGEQKANETEDDGHKTNCSVKNLCLRGTEASAHVGSESKEDRADSEVKTAKELLDSKNKVDAGPLSAALSDPSGSKSSESLVSVTLPVSGSGNGWNLVSMPGALLSPDVGVSTAVSSASPSSSSSPFVTYMPSFLHLSPVLSPSSSLFPTPPLLSPNSLHSPEVSVEPPVSGPENKPSSSSLSSATKPVRPLQIPKLVLPEHPPTSSKHLGPYSPISPAAGQSPRPYSPISPASMSSVGLLFSSETRQNPYSPITPVNLPAFGPYSPISPAALPSSGPYSPISPAAGTMLSGMFAGFIPLFSPPSWPSLRTWSPSTSSQLLSIDTHLTHAPRTVDRWSFPLDCRSPLLSVAEKIGDGTKDEQLASEEGTNALSVGRSVGSSSSSICQSAGEEKSDVPTRAHDLLRLHRSLSTDLATHEGPDKTIPLGFDEGFLSAMPLSARVNPQRLKNAFAIQHQIQEGMALSSAEPLLLPSAAAPMLMSHTLSSKELRDDVEQDDTITSSTSLDPSSQPLSRVRSASTDATFSPLPSPENTSEPDEMSVDLGVQSESSVVMVPKETRPRAKSLYIPPPNIPEYKPTPIHEPIAKRYKVDEGSRHSSNIPSFERGSSSLRSSSSSASLPYRSSSLNIPSVGLTHVRSPRDLPLPISPADSSTDKVKSPSPTSSNITTANDMKNFLNASLERKPSSRPSFSLSRSHSTFPSIPLSSGDHQSFLSSQCAFSHQARNATKQNKECIGLATANPTGADGTCHVPSIITCIPFSRLRRLPVPHRRIKRPVKRLGKAQKCTVQNRKVSKASVIVQINPSALSQTPSISSSCTSVTARKNSENVDKDLQCCFTQTTHGGTVGERQNGDHKDGTVSFEDSVIVKQQQQVFSGSLQPVAKGHLSCGADGATHKARHVSDPCPIEDSSHDRYCGQPMYSHETTSQPLLQDRQRSDPCIYDSAGSAAQRSYGSDYLEEAKQNSQLHSEHDEQLRSAKHDVLEDGEASVPLDVLELVNRLKVLAKERMIEEAVAKLMNLGASCEKSPADRQIEGKTFEDRQCLSHKNEHCSCSVDKTDTSFSLPFSEVSSQNCHAGYLASNEADVNLGLKSCGIYCESFVKPRSESCKPQQVKSTCPAKPFHFQIEKSNGNEFVSLENLSSQQTAETQCGQADRILSDGCCDKHVPPLLLRRQAGSEKGKFQIVKVHPFSDCCVDKTWFGKTSEVDISNSCSWNLNTEKTLRVQHPVDVQVFTVHRYSHEISKDQTDKGTASSLDPGNISDSITAMIESGVLQTEECDSDDIVEQINKILSESNSPSHIMPLHSVLQEKSDQETQQNLSLSHMCVSSCGTVQNTRQTDTFSAAVAACPKGLAELKKNVKNDKENKKKRRTQYKNWGMKTRGVSVSSKKGCKDRQHSSNQSLPTESDISHETNSVRVSDIHHLIKPCTVVLTDLNSSGLQLNTHDQYSIIHGKIKPLAKNIIHPDISENQNANEDCHKNHASFHTVWKNKTLRCDIPQVPTSNESTELQDDVAVCIQLEGSQPLSCNGDLFASKLESEDAKKSSSEHVHQAKSTEKSECLKRTIKADKCKTVSSNKRLQVACTRKATEVTPCGQAGKDSVLYPSKVCIGLDRKQTSMSCKRKRNQVLSSKYLNTNKQGSASQNHSWHDVLQEMNTLSASSCANKTPSESSRCSLPRIPKKIKQPEKSFPVSIASALPSPHRSGLENSHQKDVQYSKSSLRSQESWKTKPLGEKGTTEHWLPVVQPPKENQHEVRETHASFGPARTTQFFNYKCQSVIGDETNKSITLSQNRVSSVPVRTNFSAFSQTDLQISAPGMPSSNWTGHFKQTSPEISRTHNAECCVDFRKTSTVPQLNLETSQPAVSFISQRKSSEEKIDRTVVDSAGGFRPAIPHYAGTTELNYLGGSKVIHQTGSANAQLLRDPRKRALMNRGYAGMKPIPTISLDLFQGNTASNSDLTMNTSRVMNFQPFPPRETSLERDLNSSENNSSSSEAKFPVPVCASCHNSAEVRQVPSPKYRSSSDNVSKVTHEEFTASNPDSCKNITEDMKTGALRENESIEATNGEILSLQNKIVVHSPTSDNKLMDMGAIPSPTQTVPVPDAKSGLFEPRHGLLDTTSPSIPPETESDGDDAMHADNGTIPASDQNDSSVCEIVQNSPPFISREVNNVFQSVPIDSNVPSNETVEKSEENKRDLHEKVELKTMQNVLESSDIENHVDFDISEDLNCTTIAGQLSSSATQHHQNVSKLKIEQDTAGIHVQLQDLAVTDTTEDSAEYVQNGLYDSLDQQNTETVLVTKTTECCSEPLDDEVSKEKHVCEILKIACQEFNKSTISDTGPDVVATDKNVVTAENVLEYFVKENIETIEEQTEMQFSEKAAEIDFPINAVKDVELSPGEIEAHCLETFAENITDTRTTFAEKPKPCISVSCSPSSCEQQVDTKYDAKTSYAANTACVSAGLACHFKASTAVAPHNISTHLVSSPSNVHTYLPAAETCVSRSKESGDCLQEKSPSPGDKAQTKCRSDHRRGEEVLFPDEFTVIDQCGDPDISLSLCDTVIKHLISDGDFEADLQEQQKSSQKSLKEEENQDETISQNEIKCKRSQLAPGVLLKFASTVLRNCDENKKLDLQQKKLDVQQKKRPTKSASSCQSNSPSSSAVQISASGSSLKSVLSSQKKRSTTQSPDIEPQSRSPKRRKTQVPAADKRAETKSKERSRSPSNWKRGRSRSHSGSQAGSPSRRKETEREEKRQPGPTRCRDKEQIIEDRRHRQYHPYDARSRRDNCRRDDWNRYQRRYGEEDKPVADFNLAYSELGELLSDQTSKTFHARLAEKNVKPTSLFSGNCYKGRRFRGYHFRRSKVPSYSEFQALSSIEEKAEAVKLVASIDNNNKEKDQDYDEKRARRAEYLDEILGELEESQKSFGTEWNTSAKPKPSVSVSAHAVVSEESQRSSLAEKTEGDDNQSLPAQSSSSTSAATSVSREGCTQDDDMEISEDSNSTTLSQQEDHISRQRGIISSVPDSYDHHSSKHSELSSENSQVKPAVLESFIQVNFADVQCENTQVNYQESTDEFFNTYRRRFMPFKVKRQKQSLKEYQPQCRSVNDHTDRKQDILVEPGRDSQGNTRPPQATNTLERRSMYEISSNEKNAPLTHSWITAGICSPFRDVASGSSQTCGYGTFQPESEPVHRGPRTPPGPCPDDSPGHSSLDAFGLAQSGSVFPNDKSLSEWEGFAEPTPKSMARSFCRLSAALNPPEPVSEGHAVSLHSVSDGFQHETWCQPGQTLDPRMTRTRTATDQHVFFDDRSEHLPLMDAWIDEKSVSVSTSTFLDTNSTLNQQRLKLKKDCDSAQPPVCEKPDSSTVMKIINTAKLNTAVNQAPYCQTLTGPLPFHSVAGSSPTCITTESGLFSSFSFCSKSDVSFLSTTTTGQIHADQQPLITSASVQGQQAPVASEQHNAAFETPPARGEAVKEARQNMDKLVQQLHAYIASIEQARNDGEEDEESVELTPPPSPLLVRRRCRSYAVRVPWKPRLWPGLPAAITFEERSPDYHQHLSLAEQGKMVEVTIQGSDPRLDPNRPVFIPGGKSKQASVRARKRHIPSNIKVVKAIPLEPALQPGRSLPRDPRHPFRSNLDDLDHTEKENDTEDNSSAGTDSDEREEAEDMRPASSGFGPVLSGEMGDPRTDFRIDADQKEGSFLTGMIEFCMEEVCEDEENSGKKCSEASQLEQHHSFSELLKNIPEEQSSVPVNKESGSQLHLEQLENELEQQKSMSTQQKDAELESLTGQINNIPPHVDQPEQNRSMIEQPGDIKLQECLTEQQENSTKQCDSNIDMEQSECNSQQEESSSVQEENGSGVKNSEQQESLRDLQGNYSDGQVNKFDVQESLAEQQENFTEKEVNHLKQEENSEHKENCTEQRENDMVQEENDSKHQESLKELSENKPDQKGNCSVEVNNSKQQEMTVDVTAKLSVVKLVNDTDNHANISADHQTTKVTTECGLSSTFRLGTKFDTEITCMSSRTKSPEQPFQGTSLNSHGLIVLEEGISKFSLDEKSIIDDDSRRGQSISSPEVSDNLVNLLQRKRPASFSSALPEKKACTSVSSEACVSNNRKESGVEQQSYHHCESLNQELIDDVMYLDENFFSQSTENSNCLSVKKPSSKASILKTESEESGECSFYPIKTMATQAAVAPISSSNTVEVVEILSSSDYSDLEEGEIRDSPPKVLFRTHLEKKPPSPSVAKKDSLSSKIDPCKQKLVEGQEEGEVMVTGNHTPLTGRVSRSVSVEELSANKAELSSFLLEANTHKLAMFADNLESPEGKGARNQTLPESTKVEHPIPSESLQINAVTSAENTEDHLLKGSQKQSISGDYHHHQILSLPDSLVFADDIKTLPLSALIFSSLELVTKADLEQSGSTEHISNSSLQTTNPFEDDCDLNNQATKEALQQSLHSSVSGKLMKSVEYAPVSNTYGTDVLTSKGSVSQHSSQPSSCRQFGISASWPSQRVTVLNSSNNSLQPQKTTQDAVSQNLDCPPLRVMESDVSHGKADGIEHFPQTGTSTGMPGTVSVEGSMVSTDVNPVVNRGESIGSPYNIPSIVSSRSSPHCGVDGGVPYQTAGPVHPVPPQIHITYPPYHCIEAASRTCQNGASPRMTVNNHPLSFSQNSYFDPTKSRVWHAESQRLQVTENTRHLGGISGTLNSSQQQQMSADGHSCGLYNAVPVPSQQFCWSYTPTGNMYPINQIGAYQSLSQSNVSSENPVYFFHPQN